MEKNPILSIIIPTKNNEYIAAQTINAVAALKLDNVEIIVQDNSDTDNLKEKLKGLVNNKNIEYYYSNQNLSIINNFNSAVSKSNGEYICLIGDDDGVHPEILETVKWARKNKIEVIVPKLKAVYFWTDSSKTRGNGYLSVAPFTGEITRHNSRQQLIKLLNGGCLDYLNYYLPKAYHGIVARKTLENIRTNTGNYFGGLVPDIYAVTALSLIVEEVVYIDFPLTISGISPKSNSGKASKNKTNGRLEDAPQLKGRGDYIWSENIPRIFSGETIWADTLMHALDDMKRTDLKVHFDANKLYERLWLRYGNLRSQIEEHYGSKPKRESNIKRYLLNYLKYTAKKIPLIVSVVRKHKGIVIEKNVVDIESVISILLNGKYASINLRNNLKSYYDIRKEKEFN